MARFTEDDFAALRAEVDRDAERALGSVRRAAGAQQNEAIESWLRAGDNLAEKAIAALDGGDETRAAGLVARIIGLPAIEEGIPTGLMAVNLVLFNELLDPAFDDEGRTGLLDAPLRLLPGLEPRVADALRHALAAMTDYELPAAVVRRIRAVVPLHARLDPPFAGVPEDELVATVTGALRVVLQLRSAD